MMPNTSLDSLHDAAPSRHAASTRLQRFKDKALSLGIDFFYRIGNDFDQAALEQPEDGGANTVGDHQPLPPFIS